MTRKSEVNRRIENVLSESEIEKIKDRIGPVIHRMRKSAGVSQTELADVLSLHQTAVCRIEQGSQRLSVLELYVLSQFFGVKMENLIRGEVDYWDVAAKFNRNAPLPERYKLNPNSKVRDVMPFLHHIRQNEGEDALDTLLGELKIKPGYLTNPDQVVGSNLILDLMDRLLSKKTEHGRKVFSDIVDCAMKEEVQGFLYPVYTNQKNSLNLVQEWVLNAHHYDNTFSYSVQEMTENQIIILVKPADHLNLKDFRNEAIGTGICQYRQAFFKALPSFIKKEPLHLKEDQCFYTGASHCSYRISTAVVS